MSEQPPKDPFQNFIEKYPHPLDALFLPRSVAVIGAKDTPKSVGRTIMVNLLSSTFGGVIYPVNPKRQEVLGLKCYGSIGDIPEPVDLAIIVTPAATVPLLVKECVERGVKSVIVISAGFKELGESGQKLEEEMLAYAREGSMPIIGPNCLGIMNPVYGLNATFAKGGALPGKIAFISQSGAMCTAVLDWSLKENVGFSAFVSIGSMADVNWGTLIEYLGNDPHTSSLLLYMETIGDARAFMSAAREVALEKPIIVIKAGRSQEAAEAAASHTGSLAGSDEVFDAALERIGVLRVDSIGELFNMAAVLSHQPRPKGPHLTIVTNAGGPAVLATDAAMMNQASLTPLSDESLESLNHFLPAAWSHSNPIDLLGDATADRYEKTIAVAAADPGTNGILVILSPQDMTEPEETARGIARLKGITVPILASWMGGASLEKGRQLLSQASIPHFDYPDDAAKVFGTMWKYSSNLQSLYELPIEIEKTKALGALVNQTDQLINQVIADQRTLLTEAESKKILGSYGIPVVETIIATTIEQAVEAAKAIGYPVVLKLHSETITHKTDVGGVKLSLKSQEEVVQAFHDIECSVTNQVGPGHFDGVTVQQMIRLDGYELILGSSTDPQFGPVLLFGMGGQLVEIFKDRALAIPPLNRALALRLIKKTKIYQAILGTRGKPPVDIEKLLEIVVRFSKMIVENRRIKECDINPLIVSDKGLIALDARIVLHESEVKEQECGRIAIRPYPAEYQKMVQLKNGESVRLRPIKPEDEQSMRQFHRELSEESVYHHFFEFLSLEKRIAHERLLKICFADYDREIALVAEWEQDGKKRLIGICRLTKIKGTKIAQLKMTIIDAFHRQGLGTALMNQILEVSREEGIRGIDAYILQENVGMLHLCKKLGFDLLSQKDSPIIQAKWSF